MKKREVKIIPDEKDGAKPYVEAQETTFEEVPQDLLGQLSLDVFQTTEEIVIVAPIAGVSKDDLSINIHRTDNHDEVLSIRGQRSFEFCASESDYFTKECFWGAFERSVILPEAVDTSRVKASFRNGVLTIRIPKIAPTKTRMVQIIDE